MRLFLNEGSLCGFALKEFDIVSVFKHRDGPKGALDILMPKAINEGGRRLDCFSIKTGLPMMYAKFGFIPVAKVAFDPEEAPKDWNYERDGKPDIIFMAYDKNAAKNSEKDEFKLRVNIEVTINKLVYSSYDDAIEIQKKFVKINK